MSDFQISETSDIEDVPCECIVAVKVKGGGQVCQVCGGDAYDNQFVFDTSPEGQRLLAMAQDPDGDEDAYEEYASEIGPSRLGVDEPAPPAPPILPAVPGLPVSPTAPSLPVALSVPPATPTAVWTDPTDKPKRQAKPKSVKTVNPLLEAVEFVSLAQKPKGDTMATHSCMRYGAITAFDRTIAAGATIPHTELDCFPNTALLSMAMSRCGEQYRIAQTAQDLIIESGSFSAHVPVATAEQVATAIPDAMIAPLGDTFKEAMKVVSKLVKDTAPKLTGMAIQLNPHTVVATNGSVVMEAYHGFDFPPNRMLVNKRFADIINKTKRKIIGFGFSADTFTVWFEGNWWIRANVYKETFGVDLLAQMNVTIINKRSVPEHFFDAATEVATFSGNGLVYCFNNKISSHPPNQQFVGSVRTYEMDGFADCRIYSIADLKTIFKIAKDMDTQANPRMTLFWGGIVRGAVGHQVIQMQPIERVPSTYTGSTACGVCAGCLSSGVCDDDIPF